MDTHKNARSDPERSRGDGAQCVEGGLSHAAAARKFNTTPKTVAKWVKRFRTEGVDGLRDRSSRPLSSARPNPSSHMRRSRGFAPAAPHWQADRRRSRHIAGNRQPGLASDWDSTSSRALEPAEPIRRYERENPGELIHLDIKKLGRIGSVGHRITGRNPAQSTVTMASAGSSSMSASTMPRASLSCRSWPNQRKESAVAFLQAAVAYYAKLGVRIERVMTDNGSCYRSKTFRAACARLGLRQIFTRPYTPKTNGKAERFIQTALREWAYARAYQNSDQRSAELLHWLHRYNWHRPHASLKAKPPISRLGLTEDNVLRLHS